MVNANYAIISVIIAAVLGSIFSLLTNFIYRKWNMRDKEFEWYKEKVFNPIIDFVFEGLGIIDEAVLCYIEIVDSIKKINEFDILKHDKTLSQKFNNFIKKTSWVRALVGIYEDLKIEAMIEVYIDDLKGCLHKFNGENPEYKEYQKGVINDSSEIIRYISKKIMKGKREPSNRDLKELY